MVVERVKSEAASIIFDTPPLFWVFWGCHGAESTYLVLVARKEKPKKESFYCYCKAGSKRYGLGSVNRCFKTLLKTRPPEEFLLISICTCNGTVFKVCYYSDVLHWTGDLSRVPPCLRSTPVWSWAHQQVRTVNGLMELCKTHFTVFVATLASVRLVVTTSYDHSCFTLLVNGRKRNAWGLENQPFVMSQRAPYSHLYGNSSRLVLL